MEFISKNNIKIKDKWLVYNIDSNNVILYKMNESENINVFISRILH